ncbi:MAG: 3-phosphoshikimate 1-carboxyvinyltransferase [Gemmatimonadota bacterium]
MTEGAARVVGDRADSDALLSVRVPGDKSLTHRALLCAVLADGTSRLRGLLSAADPRATAAALRALAADLPRIPPDGGEVVVRGVGLRGLRGDAGLIDCGNSGTSARLLAGVLAASPARGTLDGDASLRSRPMDRVVEPLRAMGALIRADGEGTRLPLRVEGAPLRELSYASPVASAQVKSALLFAGLIAGVRVAVGEPGLSRDHTERLLRAQGARIHVERSGAAVEVELTPVERLDPLDFRVPGDPSSAACLAAFVALAGGAVRLCDVALNPTRAGFFDALRAMGAAVHIGAGSAEGEGGPEPRGDVVVRSTGLRGVTVGAEDVPTMIDELPLLAVVGSRADGETTIRGAAELRVKESDRIAATVEGLRAVGVDAEALPDGMAVRGGHHPLSGRVRVHGDHRMAMAFGVLGALPGNSIEVDDPAAVAVSYPEFWDDLRRVAAESGRA